MPDGSEIKIGEYAILTSHITGVKFFGKIYADGFSYSFEIEGRGKICPIALKDKIEYVQLQKTGR